MKNYHLTQEQALEIARSIGLSPITHGISDSVAKPILKDFANAVLDQVLGEPIRYERGSWIYGDWVAINEKDIKHYQGLGYTVRKLYAPKEQL